MALSPKDFLSKTCPFLSLSLSLIGIIDLIEDADESAVNIFNNLKEVVQQSGLDLNGLISIGADNTNVNMGAHHSVFSLFSSEVRHLVKGKRVKRHN